MESKQTSPGKSFLLSRQAKPEKYRAQLPDNPFYGPNAAENGTPYYLYTTEVGLAHEELFFVINKMYIDFAQGVEKLNRLFVFPYAAGQDLMAADLHIVPWLSYTLRGVGVTGI